MFGLFRLLCALALVIVAGCGAVPAASTPVQATVGQTTAPAASLAHSDQVVPKATDSAMAGSSVSAVAGGDSAMAGGDSAMAAAADSTAPAPAPVMPATVASTPAPVEAVSLSDGTVQTASEPVADPACDDSIRHSPLPTPGSAGAQDFFRAFRAPLAPAPLYDPPGPKRVGLQAGHWLTNEVPPELGRLQAGAVGGGKQEWEVNLDVARRTAALLQASGIQVDVLPATVPPRYKANAFVALHADGDPAGQARGFKVARPGFSSLPDVDDRLVQSINQAYGAETELPRDDEHISLRMRYYYAFNSRRYCHAVAPGVPQAIVEMGYLTSPVDRQSLLGNPDRLAHALSNSLNNFLSSLP